jgi:LacI family transcriptional regulator
MIQKGDTESISDGRFDGVLWCRPDFTEASLESIQASSVPVVMMHAPPGAVPGVSAFCADNHGALRQAVQHLASLNHRHVAFAIDPWNEKTVEGQVRAEAFLEAAKRCSFWNPEILVIDRNVQDLSRYARSDRPHTALICFSDDLAGFVLTACQELGIDVPNELSVVGFDSSSFCESTKPRLTSISQPVERMALDATNHLLSLIFQSAEGVPPSPIVSQIYDCGLEIRDSTGPPAIS